MKTVDCARKGKIMQPKNIKIFEIDITETSSEFLILEFLKKIYKKEYLWFIDNLNSSPKKGNIFPLGDWEKKINNANGCIIPWNSLVNILDSIFQIYDISIKCLNKENKEIFFLDITDGGIIYLEYQNKYILHNLLQFIVNHS